VIQTGRPRRTGVIGVIAGVALVIAAALAWTILGDRAGQPRSGEETSRSTPSAAVPTAPSDAFPITVEYVIDGDTVKASPHTPNEIMPDADTISVRLIGIDTPETYPDEECWGPEATAVLRGLAPEGTTLWAAPDAEWHDRYGRVLLYLWTSDGVFVNRELVAAGAAEALRVEPNDAHAGLFASDETAARAAGAGRWGACS